MKSTIQIFTIVVALLSATHIHAQSIYISIYGGVNTGLNKVNYLDTYTATLDDDVETYMSTEESNNFSFGAGLSFGGNVGLQVSDKLAFELGASMLKSNKVTGGYFNEFVYEGRKFHENEWTDMEASMIKFTPAVVYTFSEKRLTPYGKVGLIVGLGKVKYSENFSEDFWDNETYSSTIEETGGVSLGVNSTIGMKYKLNKTISVFGEMSASAINYAPSKGEVTSDKENGVEYVGDLDKADRYTLYKDKVTSIYGQDSDPNKPDESLKPSYAFGSIGFNFGVTFTL